MSAPRVLVAGCGFLGLELARQLHAAGWAVTGCTHSEESALALAAEPFPVRACDIAEAADVARLQSATPPWDAVVHCASSGRGGAEQYRRVYLQGSEVLLQVLRPAYFLFTGSTSVYAQTSGEEVTEESAACPDRETGHLLRAAEEVALAAGGAVARLAGIYGPGRSVLLRKFFAGEAVVEGDGLRWVNQVHRDDAASAVALLLAQRAGGIFNVVDDAPQAQRDLYAALAAHFALPLPPTGPIPTDRKRGWTHKRVLNTRLRGLGWAPRYPSFMDAIHAHGRKLAAPHVSK